MYDIFMEISLKTKIFQLFILGLEGKSLDENKNLIYALENGLGGVIFFTQNIFDRLQFKTLINDIKSKALISPFLSIDQEGGRVERTENIYSGKKYLSQKFAFEKGEDFLINQTHEILQELEKFGINLNFAPCIDVNTNPDNPIIGERAFSSETCEVVQGFKIVKSVYDKTNILPCVKHFPGHGDANADSHKTLPEINLSLEEFEEKHIKPFEIAIKDGIKMVMVAHLHCKCFDSEQIPASLSQNVIENYLIKKLGFEGIVISDDMCMKGVSGDCVETLIKALCSGINMFIYRNSYDETLNLIEDLYKIAQKDAVLREKIENSYEKIIHVKM